MACLIPLHDAGIESPRYFAKLEASITIRGRPPLGLLPDDAPPAPAAADDDDDVTNLAAVDDAVLDNDEKALN